MTKTISWFTCMLNPFTRIRENQALALGIAGILLASAVSYAAPVHFHGLLHYGAAPHDAWWTFFVEHLTVWLVPAAVVLLGGLLLSGKRIRSTGVFGSMAFAQLPFIAMSLFYWPAPVQRLLAISKLPIGQQLQYIESDHSLFIQSTLITLPSILFVVMMMIWTFHAIKTSCTLKGWKLWMLFLIGTFGADILCRYLIGMLCG